MWDGDHMGGGWWLVMGIGWLVFLGLLVVLTYFLVRHLTQSERRGRHRTTAEELLDERFARGEIDEAEYQRRRDVLNS
jgi:putative membrane protein